MRLFTKKGKKKPVLRHYKPNYNILLKEDKQIWSKRKLKEDDSLFRKTADSLKSLFNKKKILKSTAKPKVPKPKKK